MPVYVDGDITTTTLGTPATGASTSFSPYMPWIRAQLLSGRQWRTYEPADFRIADATLDWVYESGLFRPEEYDSLQAYCMPMLASIWSLGQDPEVIDLIVRGMVLISALDDKINELGRPLSAYKTACAQILRTGELPADADLYHRACLDLRRHIVGIGAEPVIPELADSVDTFMAAVAREERWRASGSMPTISRYLANRQATICAFPSMVILRLKPGVLAPELPVSTSLDQLRWLVCRLISVENDLLSSHKEEREGTTHTFFEVIKQTYGIDTPHAVLCALAIGAALRQQHDQLLTAVCNDPAEPDAARRYAEIIGTWVDSQTNYELSAPRYGMTDYLGGTPDLQFPHP
jgi:Terpene synthase family 2, C-terminal metal binding